MWMRAVLIATPWRFGYTWLNVYLLLLLTIVRNTDFAAITWCNSATILCSYEYARARFPNSMRSVVRRLQGRDMVAHAIPVALLYGTPAKMWHACMSASIHLVWGGYHQFDLNKVYKIDPPLHLKHLCELWLVAALCHPVAAILAP